MRVAASLILFFAPEATGAPFYKLCDGGRLLEAELHMSARGGPVSEAEHLPDRKVKSDTDIAIDEFVNGILEIYPNLNREEFHNQISGCVEEYVYDEDEGAEGEEEEDVGMVAKAKGLAKEAAGAVTRSEEMKIEGRLEREGSTTEGNKAYFRSRIEETNKRAADRS